MHWLGGEEKLWHGNSALDPVSLLGVPLSKVTVSLLGVAGTQECGCCITVGFQLQSDLIVAMGHCENDLL